MTNLKVQIGELIEKLLCGLREETLEGKNKRRKREVITTRNYYSIIAGSW